MLGIAQTGTGKTAAFALPVLQHLAATSTARRAQERRARWSWRRPASSRSRSATASTTYGRDLGLRLAPSSSAASASGRQIEALARGVDILVATPGRLLDLIEQRPRQARQASSFFVLDEADRMLDMGFIHDVRRIAGDAADAAPDAAVLRHHAARHRQARATRS